MSFCNYYSALQLYRRISYIWCVCVAVLLCRISTCFMTHESPILSYGMVAAGNTVVATSNVLARKATDLGNIFLGRN